MPEAVLLATKLYLPRRRRDWVRRPRLVAQLDRAEAARLILVSAPPGFGKTGLLAEWLEGRPRVAWLSLDTGDNDLPRFVTYLAAALQTVAPSIGIEARAMLGASEPAQATMALELLLNDATAFGEEIVLVLDDYQVLTAPAVHDLTAFLIEHLPRRMRLAIATRSDPPLPLARLRAQDGVLDLRAEALRFTAEEAALFMNHAMGLSLSAEQVRRLEARTEGWIAGLQLAAISLRGRADVDRVIAGFESGHRFILDLLTEEVLAHQSGARRRFLLRTSVLERLSGPLCDAVLEETGSAGVLAQLDRDNVFVTPLGDDRRWYRYHQLFRDLLRARLDAEQPDLVPVLCRRAAASCDAADQAADAIGYALAAGDTALAARIAERDFLDLLAHSDASYASRVASLPHDVVRLSAWLAAGQAFLFMVFGRFTEAGEALAELEERPDLGPSLQAFVRGLRGYHAAFTRPSPIVAAAGAVAAGEAMRMLPTEKMALRCTVGYWEGYCRYLAGDLDGAEETWLRRLEEDWHHDMSTALALTVYRVIEIRTIQGRLSAAEALAREWRRRVATGERMRLFAPGQIEIGLAWVLRARNELDGALELARAGVAVNHSWPSPNVRVFGHVPLAHLLLDTGDVAGAAAELAEIDVLLRARSLPFDLTAGLIACRVRCHLLAGEIDAAAEYAARRSYDEDVAGSFMAETDGLTLTRVALAQRRLDDAVALLDRLEPGARAGGRAGRLTEMLVLRSAALWGAGQRRNAEEAMLAALALAQPERALAVFAVEADATLPVLGALALSTARRRVAEHGVAPSFLRDARLATRRSHQGRTAVATGRPRSRTGRPEPLSEREREVLGLLGQGLTNRQIADRLIITVGTAKAHAHSIYEKLEVKGRVQAITRARELALL